MEINSATNSPLKQPVVFVCVGIRCPRKHFVVWTRPSFAINNCSLRIFRFRFIWWRLSANEQKKNKKKRKR